jgi:hypothetical protein
MRRYCLLLPVLLLGSFSVGQSQETSPQLKPRPVEPASPPGPERRINLDVQVTDKKGNPIRGLQEQDFTLLDDKQPKKIAALRGPWRLWFFPIVKPRFRADFPATEMLRRRCSIKSKPDCEQTHGRRVSGARKSASICR